MIRSTNWFNEDSSPNLFSDLTSSRDLVLPLPLQFSLWLSYPCVLNVCGLLRGAKETPHSEVIQVERTNDKAEKGK